MREGHWFVSLYNDFGDAQTVDFVAALSLEMTEGCPNGCNGHGECVLGRCQCESGYGGEDCSEGKVIRFFWKFGYEKVAKQENFIFDMNRPNIYWFQYSPTAKLMI